MGSRRDARQYKLRQQEDRRIGSGKGKPRRGLSSFPRPLCLATLRHYRSLVPMAHDARKPVFDLTPADGALGGHAKLVETARQEFESLARSIVQRIGPDL